MALVLCTGTEPALMESRALLLEQAGHTVVKALDERDLVAACAEHKFDVAVVGQSVSNREKRRIFGLIRQHCRGAKVLELYTPVTGKVLEQADEWLEVPTAFPSDLSDRVGHLFGDHPRASGE